MAKYRARVSEIQACLNISEPKPILALRLANGQTRCQIGVQHNVFFIVQVVADLHPAIYNRKCRARVSAIKLVLIAEPKPTLTPKGGKPLTINHNPPLSTVIGIYPPQSSEPAENRLYLCIMKRNKVCLSLTYHQAIINLSLNTH